jgi:HAD superfamily hydrolase (TIGR01509 family)
MPVSMNSSTTRPQNLRAVVLDRDGVLTYFDMERAASFFQPLVPFSLNELFRRWEKWGEQIGFPSTLEEESIFFTGFWEHLQQECELNDAQHRALNDCDFYQFMRCYPEVPEVLRELKRRNVAIGVLSNFSLASLERSLEAVGIYRWIDVACAATVIGFAKPQPEAYRYVAAQLHTPPEACLFLDDEAPCVAGAREVGMSAYLVDRKRTQDERARHIVHDLTAALDLLP